MRLPGPCRRPGGLVGVAGMADHGRHGAVDAAAAGRVDLPQNGGVGLAVPEHRSGDRHHLRRAPVVLVQADDLGPPEDLREPVQERRVGTVESVHRLIGVAHHEEVRLVGEEGRQQAELGRVHVLHLVDEEVAGPPPHGVGEGGIAGQGVGTGGDQIVEVQQLATDPLRFVAGEDVRHLRGADAAAPLGPAGLGLVVRRGDQAGLGPPDLTVERAHPARIAGDDIGQETAPIRQQLRLGARPLGPVLAEEPERGVVKGPRLDAGDAQRPQAGAELLGGLAAERGHQGPVGID